MRSFVYLKVLAAREHFSTAWKRALERALSSMNADVVDQLVLGLERATAPAAAHPATRVVDLFRTTHVLDGQVHDRLLHAGEDATARPSAGGRLLLDEGRRSAETAAVVAGRRAGRPQTGQRLVRLRDNGA